MTQPSFAEELNDLRKIPDDLSHGILQIAERLTFPVNSRTDLLEQLGGTEARFSLRGKTDFSPKLWVQILPAHLFPMVTKQNFIEKVGELYASTLKPFMTVEELNAMVTRVMREHSDALEPLLHMAQKMLRGVR